MEGPTMPEEWIGSWVGGRLRGSRRNEGRGTVVGKTNKKNILNKKIKIKWVLPPTCDCREPDTVCSKIPM